jgi:hypothetical protein
VTRAGDYSSNQRFRVVLAGRAAEAERRRQLEDESAAKMAEAQARLDKL